MGKLKVRAKTNISGATLWKRGQVREVEEGEALSLLNARFVELVNDEPAIEQAVKPTAKRGRKKAE